MLKHVQISPMRNRSDSLSLRSTTSSSCASSMCGSPEPVRDIQRAPSRASSYSSLNDQLPQAMIKVYTSCLKIDIEYKTLGIQWDTTSKDVIMQLLRRLKMRHRDPRLFYLSMEVSVRRAGVKTVLILDNDTRPAILQACHPKGESRFCLQLKPGGLIRVHTSALQSNSQYKSLVISQETTSDELLQLLLSCYNSLESVEQFSIYEVCPGQEYQRKLHPDDLPLRAQIERVKRGEVCHFLVRRNPNYLRRCQILTTLDEVVKNYNIATAKNNNHSTLFTSVSPNDSFDSAIGVEESNISLLDLSMKSFSDDLRSLLNSSGDEDANSSHSSSSNGSDISSSCSIQRLTIPKARDICTKACFTKSFDDCSTTEKLTDDKPTSYTYNPVYNIREIKSMSNTFPSTSTMTLAGDKNYLGDFVTRKTLSQSTRDIYRIYNKSSLLVDATNPRELLSDVIEKKVSNGEIKTTTTLAGEEVNNDPAKGLGHFVYI